MNSITVSCVYHNMLLGIHYNLSIFFLFLSNLLVHFFLSSTVASSCMTRLSRSRTTSLSSSYSMDGSRSRSRTLSQGSQGGQMPPSPSQTMEVSC